MRSKATRYCACGIDVVRASMRALRQRKTEKDSILIESRLRGLIARLIASKIPKRE